MQELLALLFLGLLQPGAARQDHVVAVLVQLDDLGVDRGADIGLEVTDPTQLHQRSRQEASKTNVDNQAALDDLNHGAGHHAVAIFNLLNPSPSTLVLGPLLG